MNYIELRVNTLEFNNCSILWKTFPKCDKMYMVDINLVDFNYIQIIKHGGTFNGN